MDVGMVLLRLAHIVGGILWAGGAIFVTWYIEPTAAAIGPKAGPFMGAFAGRKPGVYFSIAAGLAVLAGTILFFIDAKGDPIGFFTTSPFGFALGLGGLAAWVAFVIGFIFVRPLTDRLAAAGARMQGLSGPPPSELVTELEAVQAALHRYGLIDFVLLAIAIVLMATARYL